MTASRDELLKRLSDHRTIGHAPAAEHQWLVDHGTMRTYEVGEVVTAKGTSVEFLLVLFAGHLVIRADRNSGGHKIFEWRGGDVGGMLPYSRRASPPSDAVAEERMEGLGIERQFFNELIRECPVINATLVHVMVDRARQFTTEGLRAEKLVSLGKLASGLAHELNNPASAAVRSAKILANTIDASEEAAVRLGAARLSDEQHKAIDTVRAMCAAPIPGALSAVDRAEREDLMADWLEAHSVSEACSDALAATTVTIEALDTLAELVQGEALDAAICWIAAGCQVRALAGDIETAASRIHSLVSAVKGFVYMDRAPTSEPVDIRKGIADTLTMLAGKIKSKSALVGVQIPESIPRVHAIGAELNQVWMNLVENALDAIPDGGRVDVNATQEHDKVIVRVVDNGAGIPPEIQARIFEPFFTTKGVGKGSGLGLDIVLRLVQRNEGDVDVESMPGRTEFAVRLPLAR